MGKIEIDQITDGLTDEQVKAIDFVGGHARLLAGPGTGKTHVLTRKMLSLILKHKIAPNEILALTFTRLAAAQLRHDLSEVLEPHEVSIPTVSTLHSFALRQILLNSKIIQELPRPVRIADDWEERFIIQEDIKRILGLQEIKEVQDLISRLSADWEMLKAEEAGWEESFPNPKFLGALQQHKTVFGETLRAELVYRLKKTLDQNSEFKLDADYKYVLVDEYQDLNACDLSVIRSLSERGAKIFVVGDDDQSIYGFRFANPIGIREFPEVYSGAERLQLTTCYRCDKSVLRQAEFVADQDTQRLPKSTKTREGADEGRVMLVQCADQTKEAEFVSVKIKELVDQGVPAEKIVVLSRNNSILGPITDAIVAKGVGVSVVSDEEIIFCKEYRLVLSVLRLIIDPNDLLSLRTVIQLENNRLGEKSIEALWGYASSKGISFDVALEEIRNNPEKLPSVGPKLKPFLDELNARLEELKKITDLAPLVEKVLAELVSNEDLRGKIALYLGKMIDRSGLTTLENLVKSIGVGSDMIEQETAPNTVSILSMHQAKGLTFDVCFIVGGEDEFIPGKNDSEFIGDERRLLYVSMTRAKHQLYISYCTRRTGQQKYRGRVPAGGQETRKLTRFLSDAKIETIKT